jgi:hypothetical protein
VIFGANAEELIDNLVIGSPDFSPIPAEIYEDDYNSITLEIMPMNVNNFINRNDLKASSLPGNPWIVEVQARRTLLAKTGPGPNKIVVPGMMSQNGFLSSNVRLFADRWKDELGVFHHKFFNFSNSFDVSYPTTIEVGINVKNNGWEYIPAPPALPVSVIQWTCGTDKRCIAGKTSVLSSGDCCWLKKKFKNDDPNTPQDESLEEDDPEEIHTHGFGATPPSDHGTVHKDDLADVINGAILPGTVSPLPATFFKKVTLKVVDRTPPMINDENGNQMSNGHLPVLFDAPYNNQCTTGDYIKIKEIKFQDNSGGNIWSRIAVGAQADLLSPTTWMWADKDPLMTQSGDLVPHIIVPNECKGMMNYTLFAWDEENNLNPGIPYIRDNDPDNCYGVPGHGSLKTGHDFPYKASLTPEQILDKMKNNEYSGTDRDGIINVTDNDRPNIVIKIESLKDKGTTAKYALAFPPPSKNILTDFPTAYQAFIEGCVTHEEHLGVTGGTPIPVIMAYLDYMIAMNPPSPQVIDDSARLAEYYNFLKQGSNKGVPGVMIKDGKKWRPPVRPSISFAAPIVTPPVNSTDPYVVDTDYVTLNYRMENYATSDTNEVGQPDNDVETAGERMGFGQETLAISKEPIIEDVEYQLWVYAEDNVKWSSPPPNTVNPSGIHSLKIKIRIPNQSPPMAVDLDFPDPGFPGELAKVVHGPYRFVCQEPTSSVDMTQMQNDSSYMRAKTDPAAKVFPFVEVEARDASGLRRALKVVLPVVNSSAKVRILEQKYKSQ